MMSLAQTAPSTRLEGWVEKSLIVVALLGALALLAGMGLIVFDVIRRTAQGVSLQGSLDLVRLCVMTCAFLSIPLVFLSEKNVAIEFPTDGLSPRWSSMLRGVVALISGGFLVTILVFGFGTARQQIVNGEVSQTLGIPGIWYWLAYVVGCGLGVVATLMLAIRCFLVASGHRPLSNAHSVNRGVVK